LAFVFFFLILPSDLNMVTGYSATILLCTLLISF